MEGARDRHIGSLPVPHGVLQRAPSQAVIMRPRSQASPVVLPEQPELRDVGVSLLRATSDMPDVEVMREVGAAHD